LVDNEKEMEIFQKELEKVRNLEKSLLAYWDQYDSLNADVRQFYYSSFGLKGLNKSSLALNASTILEIFNSWKYLMVTLSLGGISAEYTNWLYGKSDRFDIMHGIRAGLQEPIRQHSPYRYVLGDPENTRYTFKDYLMAFMLGSWRDKYDVVRQGYLVDKDSLGVLGMLTPESTGVNPASAFISATIPTLFFDYQWANAIISTGKRIISMNKSLNELNQRISDVAQCIDAIQKLNALVAKRSPMLRSYIDIDDQEMQESFFDKLLTSRFLKKSDYFYSRGHVLTMHLEMMKKKQTLIPLLHSVAFLDAYCSIAQLYKESQEKAVVFSFPEFIESEVPFINYQTAWLPLLDPTQAVSNNIVFGKTKPAKIIITGPNGGGKSTFLKSLGIGVILAQSWGIVPAEQAQQTLFSVIRTGLAPREDLAQGLSTFMAEKKTMVELLEDIHRSNNERKTLVLVDEPYKGTVDAESAKRIYDFGKDIAHYPQALVIIATHVKKPITLAKDTAGIFGNYQVKIRETSLGVFERLFKLEEGPADWWFEDAEKRSRFVDWISVKDSFRG
jgi:energy-coupling factor transporter ATP-binding protein EcfA2